ncbi:GIY-YIG nuclease family protein [Bradyrhizobium diazoefficiens]|uniref:GIY-YIG nuclease family protein n=1 Tax=Bradyrhizobium diazoefficiens TaxID=1355477 RepID=UPI0027145964|nr:GIY-YIG nuclease family protein [Bradyrhizobium diazoefficiens]WLB40268.1 GIY-YIG nuclease family protein [Bradyrhizobium diazoefficiens]WLC14758.1 GIY-YIG nuclease family protein [Bradyrhizobium diazoefficiens]
MTEIVYVLTNEAMPGLVKIGCTQNDLAGRVRGLFQTGVPLPFEVFYACEVQDCKFVEKQIHDAFGDHRVSKSREFFRIAPERVKAALLIGAKAEIKIGDEIFEGLPDIKETASEMKAEVEAAKRRARFRLEMIGIKPGTELQLEKSPSITCKTLDENNQVEFGGEKLSLSRAALKAINSLGYNWDAVSGPWEWMYQGKRLDEIRREIEDEAD